MTIPKVNECFFSAMGAQAWMSLSGMSRSRRYSYVNSRQCENDREMRSGPTLSFLYMATCPPRKTNHRFFQAFLRSPFFMR